MISDIHHSASESFWISCALICASLLYLRGSLRLRRHEHENVEGWRAGSFVLGLLFVWIATASPLARLDHDMLTAHIVQHLLLMTLGPPLMACQLRRRPRMYVAEPNWPPEFEDALWSPDVLRRNPPSRSAEGNIGHRRLETRVLLSCSPGSEAQMQDGSNTLSFRS
jgi:hypothetical protein